MADCNTDFCQMTEIGEAAMGDRAREGGDPGAKQARGAPLGVSADPVKNKNGDGVCSCVCQDTVRYAATHGLTLPRNAGVGFN